MSSTEQTLERLLAIDWTNRDLTYDHVDSRGRLFVEYLRRMAVWVRELNENPSKPFVDLGSFVQPAVRADPSVIDRLEPISVYIHWPPVRQSVEAMLHWAAIKDHDGVPPQWRDLPDPYEPLLIMFERGGAFITEHGFVDIGLAMIPLNGWRERADKPQKITLDPEALDAIDKQSRWKV